LQDITIAELDSMPYIKEEHRERARKWPTNAGELNYQLTMFVLEYLATYGHTYDNMNEIVGTLENVKHEFQRRVMDIYENIKCHDNGDVYPLPPVPR
jgi:hypothetical protein